MSSAVSTVSGGLEAAVGDPALRCEQAVRTSSNGRNVCVSFGIEHPLRESATRPIYPSAGVPASHNRLWRDIHEDLRRYALRDNPPLHGGNGPASRCVARRPE